MRSFTIALLSTIVFGLLLLPVRAEDFPTSIYKRPGVDVPQCASFTEDEFRTANSYLNPVLLSAYGEPLSRLLDVLNKPRVAAGLWSLEADHVLVGIWQKNDKLWVSFALFKDSCLVPGSSQSKTVYEWLKIAEDAGITFDDFRGKGEDV